MVKSVHRSIFIKLLLVILVTGVFINMTLLSHFHFFGSPSPKGPTSLSKNVDLYLQYVIGELGSPPSLERAKEFSEKTGLEIRLESPFANWTTSEVVPSSQQVSSRREGDPVLAPPYGRVRDGMFTMVDRKYPDGEVKYIFFLPRGPRFGPTRREVSLLIMVVSLLLVGSYFVIRGILGPLNSLSTGVSEIRQGNLGHTVPVKGRDELGELAHSFNAMTKQIREMIHAKEQLLLDVSHELRSPLTRIKVALEFLPDDKIKTAITDDANELENMIQEILDTARLDSPYGALSLESLNLSALVGEVVARYEKMSSAVKVTQSLPEVTLKADSDRLKRVLANLIENALKHSSTEKPVEVRMGASQGIVTIEVKDFGQGIASEELSRIFEPFYRVDKSRSRDTGGFGLGLSLCRKIVRAHGGDIHIESVLGSGTTAIVTLPLT
jgi:signal transduction histidine kinase